MTSTWPTASSRRGCGALDSGTNSAVSTIAASPTGMFTQKMPRQPTDAISSPPTTGPRARLTPTAAPQTPMARARERVHDDGHGHRVEHGAADRLQHPERHQPAQAGRETAQQRADRERG